MINIFLLIKIFKKFLINNKNNIGVMFLIGLLVNEFSSTFYEIAKLTITLDNYSKIILFKQMFKLLIELSFFCYLNEAILENKKLVFTAFGANIFYSIITNI